MNNDWLRTMDKDGMTPLDRAFRSGHMAVAEFMLEQDREDRAENLQGTNPLHRAACLGLTEAVRSLLGYGANPTTRDQYGENAMHKAARKGNLHVVEALAEVSDVNTKSSSGMTPLHWACLTGNAEVVRVLLQHGADPFLRNEAMDGLTPSDLATIMEYEDICQLLGAGLCFA